MSGGCYIEGSKESVKIVYENAGVGQGDEVFNLCFLTRINSTVSYSGYRKSKICKILILF